MTSFDIELPATLAHLGDARRRLRSWLDQEVTDDVAGDDLLAAAGEFFLHVVFRTGGLGRARITAERGPGGMRLAITAAQTPQGRDVRVLAPKHDPLAAGALGRRMVEGSCDQVRVERAGSTTVGAECFRSVEPTVRP